MLKRIVILLCCLVPALSWAQQDDAELYRRLESLYQELIHAHLQHGEPCGEMDRTVERKQEQLGEALSQATPATGERVLLFAVAANRRDLVRRLNEDGANRAGDEGSLLHVAARFADPPVLSYLVSIGFGLEEHGGASGPALLVAVSEDRKDNVAWLVENGADVNAIDTAGGTVLRHSLVCQDQELVDYLLEAGAVPDQATRRAAQRLGIGLEE